PVKLLLPVSVNVPAPLFASESAALLVPSCRTPAKALLLALLIVSVACVAFFFSTNGVPTVVASVVRPLTVTFLPLRVSAPTLPASKETALGVVEFRAPELPRITGPAWIVSPPVNVLLTFRFNAAPPFLVTPPAPLRTPLRVVAALPSIVTALPFRL